MNPLPSLLEREGGGTPSVVIAVPTLGQRILSLEKTLASIRGQSDVDVSIALITPKPTPHLEELAHRFKARLLLDSGHISAAVNRALLDPEIPGRYCGWLGDDDFLLPGALGSSIALLERHPDATVAFGACDYVDSAGDRLFTKVPPPLAPWLLQVVPGLIKQEASLFRREAFIAIGGLDPALRWAMDLDLLLRLHRKGHFVRNPQVAAAFCWHPGSLTVANRETSLKEAMAIQRRRASPLLRPILPVLQSFMKLLIQFVAARIDRHRSVRSGGKG